MSEIWIIVIGLSGWAVAGFMAGMWRGERRARIFIQNFQLYGQPNSLQKAVTWSDDIPEDSIAERIEETVQELESTMGVRVTRSGPGVNGKIEFDEQTIENGVEALLKAAKEENISLTPEEARDHAERMLNAEGPEMI